MCGLKLAYQEARQALFGPHPSWVSGLKRDPKGYPYQVPCVTPFVGVWIETLLIELSGIANKVTPFVGVWIETPSIVTRTQRTGVTPFVGVWIETGGVKYRTRASLVTPFVGVWIETPCHKQELF